MNDNSQSILGGPDSIRDQVILPNRVAFRICMRGIRTRLGRSLVTLLGVSLGITFLMAVLGGYEIKRAMQQEAEELRAVDRRLAVMRSEIGNLRGKSVLAVVNNASETDLRFLTALAERHNVQLKVLSDDDRTRRLFAGADLETDAKAAHAVLGIGDYEHYPQIRELLAQPQADAAPFLVMRPPAETFGRDLKASGRHYKQLDVELRAAELEDAARRKHETDLRMYWIVTISLFITVMGIANAMLMSVTERIREIGTMKCLGALPGFVVKLFLIESSLLGFCGAVLGAAAGALFSILTYAATFGLTRILISVNYGTLAGYALLSVITGIILAIIAAIYPARVAARMIPAVALTSNV